MLQREKFIKILNSSQVDESVFMQYAIDTDKVREFESIRHHLPTLFKLFKLQFINIYNGLLDHYKEQFNILTISTNNFKIYK